PASGEVTAYKSCIGAQLEHKKEPLNPELPGENQQESTLHLTLIMALVLGSGFMRRTTELSPYVNYYYQLKAAVPISAAINVRQISVGSGPKIHGFHGLAKRTEIAVGEEATAPVGFNAGC
ncbi:hypothetical protein NC653_027795, partial [Populus alba x Populus x berolinensis]